MIRTCALGCKHGEGSLWMWELVRSGWTDSARAEMLKKHSNTPESTDSLSFRDCGDTDIDLPSIFT